MAYDNSEQKPSIFSRIIRAGKRRTYFFDVKESRANDYYLIVTESRKRFDDRGYDKSKIFIYKEDLNKFVNTVTEVVNHIKVELMPNYNFDEFNHESINPDYVKPEENLKEENEVIVDIKAEELVEKSETKEETESNTINSAHESVDKW